VKAPGAGIRSRAGGIRLLAMDVDGVLTGGEIIILNSGEEVKIWSVKDRMGFALLKRSDSGIRTAWVTARRSLQVKKRARDIGVDFLFQKCLHKWRALESCAEKLGIPPRRIAYIGDDYVDLPVLRRVGLAVCPPESPGLVKKTCHLVTKTPAGRGAVREVIELILKAQGRWKKALGHFALLACLALPAAFTAGCTGGAKPPAESAEVPDQWVEEFTITETLAGVPVWVLNSQIAQVYNQSKKITLENIHIEFMKSDDTKRSHSKESLLMAKKNLTVSARLEAPKGQVFMDSRDLLAWGGVEVESEDGTRLYSERLRYSTADQKIRTESPVRIVRRDSILIGEGMEATPDLSTVRIFRHEASIYPKELPVQ